MNMISVLREWHLVSTDYPTFINVIIVLLFAGIIGFVVYFLTTKVVAKIIINITRKTSTHWDDYLFNELFFKRLGLLAVPIVLKMFISSLEWEYTFVLIKMMDIWLTLSIILVITAVLGGINRIYEGYSISRSKPIRVFIQVIEIILYCAAAIIIISILIGKDPGSLLVGLGAFAAVLMLVFRDTILGLVAGVQLSANNMLRIGDWIEMPSSRADGDVTEINLTTVKVQNWDKTITTIPTYKLVSESFTNWRGMEESRGRRIKRSINIDVYSIRYLNDSDLEKLKASKLLNEYIEQKIADIQEYNANRGNELDERRLTNIGTFREYIESWIASNPDINQEMTHMVRQLQPGPTGLPLEIYCFSARQKWVEYERVQADLFDHIYAVMELFDLQAFQYGSYVPSQNG